MQEVRSSNPPVVTGFCDPNKSRTRHHRNVKTNSVNPLHLIFSKVNEYVEKINKNKYLTLVPTNESK